MGGVQEDGKSIAHRMARKQRTDGIDGIFALSVHEHGRFGKDRQLRPAQPRDQQTGGEHRGGVIFPHNVGGPAAQDKTLGKALLLASGKTRDHEVAEAELGRALAHQMQHFIFRLDCGTVHLRKEISISLASQGQLVTVSHNLVTDLPAYCADAS